MTGWLIVLVGVTIVTIVFEIVAARHDNKREARRIRIEDEMFEHNLKLRRERREHMEKLNRDIREWRMGR